MEPKKVLIVAHVGGFLPQFEMDRVLLLQRMGAQVHYAANLKNPVYALDQKALTDRNIILHDIPVAKSPARLADNASAVRMLTRIIDTCGIDLVHCHTPMGGAAARLAAAKSRRVPKVVYTAHGFHFCTGAPPANWLFYPAERALARMTDCVITINREDYDRSKKFHLRPGGFCRRIPGVGLDTGRFFPRPELRAAARAEAGAGEDCFHILCTAELCANKNLSTAIRAVAGMPGRNVRLTVCGEGAQRPALEALICELGLADSVRLLGYRRDVDVLLQGADCFVFPSLREGLGMAALEAMACGVPVVAADNRGTREYMENGKNGFAVSARDPAAFAKALTALADDPLLRAEMGQCARETAQRFSIEHTRAVMEEVYGTLLETEADHG